MNSRSGDDQLIVQRLLRVQDAVDVKQAHTSEVNLVVLVHGLRLAAGEIEHHPVNLRPFLVVVVVALEDQALPDPVLGQPERAGAIGVVGPLAAAALYVFPVEHKRGRVGELGQEIGLGLVDSDLESAVVYGLHPGHVSGVAFEHVLRANDVVQVRFSNR